MIIDLNNFYSMLEVKGADAVTFLQGQITNDIHRADEGLIYSGICNPKGRLFAFLRIVKIVDNFILICPKQLASSLQLRLKMFILRSKVEIEINKNLKIFGIMNNRSSIKQGNESLFPLPSDDNRQLLLTEDKDGHFINLMDKAMASTNLSQWLMRDIQSGIPEIMPETQERLLVHTCNLDHINAVSFKKGCYTGQEIVARTHYLGKPKHRCFYGIIDSCSMTYGDSVFQEDNSVGTVVNFIATEDINYVLFEKGISIPNDNLVINGKQIESIKSFVN
ncbi:MAG: hypothetical protein O2959_01425 [Proteobacteria bacterium]|nr:hypothetical protein [Pseudomonadota bacterium]